MYGFFLWSLSGGLEWRFLCFECENKAPLEDFYLLFN
jgi:hypothetical protein